MLTYNIIRRLMVTAAAKNGAALRESSAVPRATDTSGSGSVRSSRRTGPPGLQMPSSRRGTRKSRFQLAVETE